MTTGQHLDDPPSRVPAWTVRVTVGVAVVVGIWWAQVMLVSCIGPCDAPQSRTLWRWDRWVPIVGGLGLLTILVIPVVQAASILRSASRRRFLLLIIASIALAALGVFLSLLIFPLAWVVTALVVTQAAVRSWPDRTVRAVQGRGGVPAATDGSGGDVDDVTPTVADGLGDVAGE